MARRHGGGEGAQPSGIRGSAEGTRRAVRLSELLPEARFVGCDDIVARGVCDDPDACRPGDLFVARVGDDADGHDVAARALSRGVAGVVAERMIPTFGVPLCLVPDASRAMSLVAQSLQGDPSRRLRVVAITGTAGKTTTAWLSAAVLAEGGLQVGVLSDLGCLDGAATTPEGGDWRSPAGLAEWLSRCVATGCSHAVVEVSSAMLAAGSLAGVTCDTVVVTNVGRANPGRHGTTDAYHAVTGRIVDTLHPSGRLVADLDDRGAARLAARGGADRLLPVGLRRPGFVGATALERGLDGQTFLLRHGADSAVVSVGTPVGSFVRDGLCAAAVGLRAGLPLNLVARGLESAGEVPGRLDRIARGQDVHVFADCPTSGRALATTLASLRRMVRGRLVLLVEEPMLGRFGDPRRFAARAARWCDDCLTVPADVVEPDADARSLAAYARIDRLLTGLRGGDCVLVVGRAAAAEGSSGPRDPFDPDDPWDPAAEMVPLSVVVDAWMRLARPGDVPAFGRRAA